jgi:hypothetical protein
MPVRAIAGADANVAWAQFPLQPLHSVLVIGREGGPPYLRAELVHGERVIALVLKALDHALRSNGGPDNMSELTACLAERPGGKMQSA